MKMAKLTEKDVEAAKDAILVEIQNLQQGHLLSTTLTRNWTQDEIDRANAAEQQRIFRHFSNLDGGSSREAVANAVSPEYAARLVLCWNVCKGFSAKELQNIFAASDTLKERLDGLQDNLKDTSKDAVRYKLIVSNMIVMTEDGKRALVGVEEIQPYIDNEIEKHTGGAT